MHLSPLSPSIQVIKSALPTGRINLSNHGLESIPAAVFQPDLALNDSSGSRENSNKAVSFDRSDTGWWETVELARLTIADNSITEIDEKIGDLASLVYLDVCGEWREGGQSGIRLWETKTKS